MPGDSYRPYDSSRIAVEMNSLDRLASAMTAMGRAKLAPLKIQYQQKLTALTEQARTLSRGKADPATIEEDFERQVQFDSEFEAVIADIEQILIEEDMLKVSEEKEGVGRPSILGTAQMESLGQTITDPSTGRQVMALQRATDRTNGEFGGNHN